jgi:chromosome segregation protein
VLQAEITERQNAAERLRTEIETSSTKVLRCEDEILQLRQRLSELEHQISASQQQGTELKAQCDRHESRIQFNEERLQELEHQNFKALSEIAEAEERTRVTQQELAAVADRLASSTAALEDQRVLLEEKRQTLQQIEAETQRQQEALRQGQSDAFAAMQQLTRVRNEINALDLQKQGNVVRLEKLSSEKIQLEEERTGLEARLTEFAANVKAQKLNAQTQRGTVEQRQQRLREIQQELTQAAEALDDLLRRQAEKHSRQNLLEQLQESHEGFSVGALAALKQSRLVVGSLADRIRVPDQHIAAIEAALGHHLQLVLTERPDFAEEILADLATNKKGRASIAALGLVAAGVSPAAEGDVPPLGTGLEEAQDFGFIVPSFPPGGTPGSLAGETPAATSLPFFDAIPAEAPNFHAAVPAASVVEADISVRPLVQRLLGLTRIVPDLAAATAAWRESHGAFDFVTATGELLTRHGVFTGGVGNGNQAPASILARKNQIAQLQAELTQLQEQVNDASRQKGALQSEQTALQASLQQAQTDLRDQEVAIAAHEGEFNALQNSLRSLHSKIETVVYEVQSVAAQDQEGRQKRAELGTQAMEAETREQTAQAHVSALTAALEQLRQRRDAANAVLTEAKVALAAEEQLCASLARQKQPLEQRLGELGQTVQQRRGECSSFLQRKAQFETEMGEAQRQIQRLTQERGVVSQRTAELGSEKEKQDEAIATREEGLRELRRRLNEVQQQRGGLEVELAQKTMSVQNLRERIQQKYQVNLDHVRSECITITIADEGPARIQTLTPEEMAASGAATDWTAVADQVGALQRRLDEMGPVNLVAIEEYEETEQRYNFLTQQHEDLVQAKVQLLEVINRINTQTREMFTETFNRIRDNFRLMFQEVFGGGKADLVLVDEGDVLESGIDIVARPPGKQLQTISLLSGGEQTMTAVALLFSIYQVRPSPFCVLDELDAPLDESNINRFIRVLQRFLEHSQFIIITHNKRTIGMADVLYGVTMQERGISSIVSVKFHKAEEQVTDHAPKALEPLPDHSVEEEEDKLQSKEETVEVAMAK